ncbi:hypothetical protein ACFL6W_03055 [Thermodesulfobacteriota bacterium]
MTYYHWAAEPVILQSMTYPQMGHPKPNGLWFDVDCSWKQWCEAIQFRLEDLDWRHTVILQDTSKILFLRNVEDIDVFTSQYGHDISGQIQPIQSSQDLDTFADQYGKDLFNDLIGQFSNYIMWEEVAGKYSGIIIDPYFPERCQTYLWYYGWNCAGGCVWDTSMVRLGKPFQGSGSPC